MYEAPALRSQRMTRRCRLVDCGFGIVRPGRFFRLCVVVVRT